MGDTGDLKIRYTDRVGKCVEEAFDMVILEDKKKGITVGPNPFTPGHAPFDRAVFKFDNPSGETAFLEVYDLYGRKVYEGPHETGTQLSWDGCATGGKACRDGAYVYQVKVGGTVHNGTVVLAR